MADADKRSENFPPSEPVFTVLATIAEMIVQTDEKAGPSAGQEFMGRLTVLAERVRQRNQRLSATEREDVKQLVGMLALLVDHVVQGHSELELLDLLRRTSPEE